MTIYPPLFLCTCVLALTGCTTLEPAIDTKPTEGYDLVDKTKVDRQQYEKDYEFCATLANQNSGTVANVATRTVGTAADRATLGIVGHRAPKDADRRSVLKRCLTGRGYTILR